MEPNEISTNIEQGAIKYTDEKTIVSLSIECVDTTQPESHLGFFTLAFFNDKPKREMTFAEESFEIEIPDFDVTTPTSWDLKINCDFCYNLPLINWIITIIVYYEAFIDCFN